MENRGCQRPKRTVWVCGWRQVGRKVRGRPRQEGRVTAIEGLFGVMWGVETEEIKTQADRGCVHVEVRLVVLQVPECTTHWHVETSKSPHLGRLLLFVHSVRPQSPGKLRWYQVRLKVRW